MTQTATSTAPEECWCGSGHAHAVCHLDRDKQKRPTLQEIIDSRADAFSRKICLHPEAPANCTKVIRAHTIQRGGNLSAIARDGHVYCIHPDLPSLIKNDGKLIPELRGVNQVSVIHGFCGHHDKQLFAPLEDNPFSWTKEQCFLLGYRALARELYGKLAYSFAIPGFREMDKGTSYPQQMAMQHMINLMQTGAERGLKDLRKAKAEHDTCFRAKEYSSVRHFGFDLNKMPPVLCSTGLTPTKDFAGRRLQTLSADKPVQVLWFNMIATRDGGSAVFTWLPSAEPVATKFIWSLGNLSDARVPDALVRMVFNQSDNLAINPYWWEAVSEDDRATLMSRVASHVNPDVPTQTLVEDGLQIAQIAVEKRHRG